MKIRKIGVSQKAAIEIFGSDLISIGFDVFKMGDLECRFFEFDKNIFE